MKLAITGCQGRMGQRIALLASRDKSFKITALIESPDRADVPAQLLGVKVSRDINAIKGADVLIDFTLPGPSIEALKACLKHNVRAVIGTTGFSEEQRSLITKASRKIAIVQSTNMSVGVNLVFGLLKQMATVLKGYDVGITETHHVHKKDAPSGTAKTMAEVVEGVTGKKITDIESLREGEVVGYHKVVFEGPVDTIEISHNAKDRDMFVAGALVAAKFLKKKDKGLFNMQQVLGLI